MIENTFEFINSFIGLGILLIPIALLLYASLYLVRQAEAIVIERLGKYHRTLGPGLHILIPFFERPRKIYWTYTVEDTQTRRYRSGENDDLPRKEYTKLKLSTYRIDLREAVYDFPKQYVITKDNVTMQINALLYYRIFNPKDAVYQVENLPEAIEKLTQTTLRNIIGSLDLDESLVSRDQINEKLTVILDEATDEWGVKVHRVELQEVHPPEDIRLAMEKQMRAERDRRAAILEAEGKKGAAILEAEGIQESQVLKAKGEAESKALRAEGEATARLKVSEAEAQAIAMIKEKLSEQSASQYLIAMQYIKALPEIMKGKNDKMIVVPYETSAMISSLASLKKIFDETGTKK